MPKVGQLEKRWRSKHGALEVSRPQEILLTNTRRSDMAKKGLYANIHKKRERIAAGSGEKMRKPGSKGAPTAAAFKKAAKTAKTPKKRKNRRATA